MYKNSNVYYPLDHFMPPDPKEKITMRECLISKTLYELEKYAKREEAANLEQILKNNGFTYFQKLLEADLKDLKAIKGIGEKSLEILIALRSDNGVEK